MTKERRLAIEMWQDIRKKLARGELPSNLELPKARSAWLKVHNELHEAKSAWLKAHKINWYAECWFCHYFRQDLETEDYDESEERSKSSQCPLNRARPYPCGGHCLQYRIAYCISNPMEQRLAAVDNIIKALKGEYKE